MDLKDPKEQRNANKNPAAVTIGRAGGKARAKALTSEQRKQIASAAAISRWSKIRAKE